MVLACKIKLLQVSELCEFKKLEVQKLVHLIYMD